jgi:hypothetical protein
MKSQRWFHHAAWFWMLALAACPAHAGEEQAPNGEGKYLRMVRDAQGDPTALESAIVRFSPPEAGPAGPTVDLVSAVHVADGAYYEKLNELFADYDAVLYELVAPQGTRVPRGGPQGSTNPVTGLQTGMTRLLELEFQLAEIDYQRDNMVHADMSPEQFRESMQRRGETVTTMFMRMLGYAMARQSQDAANNTDAKLLMALLDPDRANALKSVMAEQFEDMDGMLGFFDGPDGSTIITERNRVAMNVLREQIDAGKKKIAIFYGAGHMPNFERRLEDELGMERGDARWLTAWDLVESDD